MRILMTGGSGVLGRASRPFLSEAGHRIDAPRREELDLFDPAAVAAQVRGTAAVLHLAAHIPPQEAQGRREAWLENDRLRREATGILVDAALAARVECFVFPSLAFIYPPSGPVDESTPLPEDMYEIGRSAVDAERHVARFCAGGGRGVVLRLGGLYGPGAESDMPIERYVAFGATLFDRGRWPSHRGRVARTGRPLQRRPRRRACDERAVQNGDRLVAELRPWKHDLIGPRGTTERKGPAHSDRCGRYRCSGRSTGAGPMPGSRPAWYLTHEYVGRDQTCDLQKLRRRGAVPPR